MGQALIFRVIEILNKLSLPLETFGTINIIRQKNHICIMYVYNRGGQQEENRQPSNILINMAEPR